MPVIAQVIVGLLLLGSATLISTSYLVDSKKFEVDYSERVAKGLYYLETLWNRYRLDNESYSYTCGFTNPDTGDCEDYTRSLSANGYLPTATWEADLFPAYGFKPDFEKSFNSAVSLLYGIGSKPYFCISLTAPDEMDREVATMVKEKFAIDKVVLADSCGSTTQIPASDASFAAINFYMDELPNALVR